MTDLSKIIGMRIRHFRNEAGLSQEQLAERADLHFTYIGQIERGEKNVTLKTIYRISEALGVSLETLFAKIGSGETPDADARACYEMVLSLPREKQRAVRRIVAEIVEIGA